MVRSGRLIFALTLALDAAACASGGAPRTLPPLPAGCVLLAGVDSWKRIDDSTAILVETGSGRRIRVRTAVACHALRRAEEVRLTTRTAGILCADAGDRLVADGQECGIAGVEIVPRPTPAANGRKERRQ